MNHETLEMAKCAVNTAGTCMIMWGFFTLFTEFVGRAKGQPGLGLELNRQAVATLKELFFPAKSTPKK